MKNSTSDKDLHKAQARLKSYSDDLAKWIEMAQGSQDPESSAFTMSEFYLRKTKDALRELKALL